MMSLSAALGTAKSALMGNQTQMALISRNTAGASDAAYSRKIASVVTQSGAVVVMVQRAANPELQVRMLTATSAVTYSRALMAGLASLNSTIGDTDIAHSPAAKIGELQSALVQFSQAPDKDALGRTVVAFATNLADGLNAASATTQKVRQDADNAIGNAVGRVNDLLNKFDIVNQDVMKQVALGKEPSDALDLRDSIISQLSEELGIQVVDRPGGEVALYTDSGVTLYDKSPRAVTFQATTSVLSGVSGNAVFIDGVPVTGDGSPMPLQNGNIFGQASIRDQLGPQYQAQLDEIARGLIDAFKEVDQSGAGGPDLAGLFSSGNSTAIPGSPATVGLAASLVVNPALLAQADGGSSILRDGGLNGGAYRYNSAAAGSDASFTDRLNELVTAFSSDRPIDPSFGFGAEKSLREFATTSAGWLQGQRSAAATQSEYSEVVLYRSSEALSNATGVNLDEETANMLQLEQAYAANAKLIGTIMDMLKTLLSIV